MQGVDYQSFLVVLQYLYTDHCPSLAMIPAENVLILADRLCLSRLVQICEIHIHKELQQFVSQVYVHVANEFLDALAFSKVSRFILTKKTH